MIKSQIRVFECTLGSRAVFSQDRREVSSAENETSTTCIRRQANLQRPQNPLWRSLIRIQRGFIRH